ncbi:hypothetical protein F2P81_016855 [Scophthalmus maximus]|uniref:Uncharacterized protein n=1 Tax=Scophthalmus maximus TaxID=52904 RepID=A0A6A4SGR2_SCOMX|nr:hypothetical protein F2P81_016855 [Scophthalmus maximus]
MSDLCSHYDKLLVITVIRPFVVVLSAHIIDVCFDLTAPDEPAYIVKGLCYKSLIEREEEHNDDDDDDDDNIKKVTRAAPPNQMCPSRDVFGYRHALIFRLFTVFETVEMFLYASNAFNKKEYVMFELLTIAIFKKQSGIRTVQLFD